MFKKFKIQLKVIFDRRPSKYLSKNLPIGPWNFAFCDTVPVFFYCLSYRQTRLRDATGLVHVVHSTCANSL